jgi:cytochrome c-type biogenesis protein CcsB
MNHELHHRGFALYQSSYRQENGQQATVLSVSKDPGQNLVFTGYITLIAGMIIVLATRIAQARELAGAKVRSAAILGAKALVAAVLLAGAGTLRAGAGPDTLRVLPVQHDGRVMPMDTLARETVWEITGASAWHGQDPMDTFTAWLFDPPATANAPVVKVGSASFARELGLPPGTSHASFQALAQNAKFLELIQAERQAQSEDQPRHGDLQEAEAADKRMGIMQTVLQQQIARPVPVPGNPSAAWSLPPGVTAEAFAALLDGPRPEGWPSAARIDTEVLYNRLHPSRWSWIILLASLGAAIAAWNRRSKALDGLALGLLVAGFAMMSWGIQLRWVSGGRIPAANMYESMLFLAWGVGFFAVAAYAVMRNRLVVVNAASMAALAMMLTDLLPIDPFIHPVPPVLAGTPWLAIHVPIIMVSYSILALGLVVAHMQIGFTIFAPARTEAIDRMYELLYWYIFVGSLFLITGIITGSMWAASSWGRYWGWDPKEVWSLVAFLAYMAILHAKLDQVIGKFGVAAISIAAFQTILMTYLGVNFVLTTGMHSYAMGDTPVVMWMVLAALVEVAFLAWGTVAYRRSLGKAPA